MSEETSGSRLSSLAFGRDDEPPDDGLDRSGPPDNEIPGTVAWDAELLSLDGYVLFCSSLEVYSNGFAMRLEMRARDRQQGHGLTELLHRSGPDQVLVGVEFADGRRGRNAGWGPGYRELIGGVSVSFQGGSGSDRSADADLFVAPLPPPGPAHLVCAWPARGVGDIRTELPVAEILAAGGRVRVLWPRQRRDDGPAPVEEPAVPEDSWFAR